MPGGSSRIRAVVIGDGKEVEIGLLFHVPQEMLDRLISIAPGIVTRVGVKICLAHNYPSVVDKVYDVATVVFGAVTKTTVTMRLTPSLTGSRAANAVPAADTGTWRMCTP